MRTLAGVLVTPDTAVTISAVWACLRYLSQTVAVLPWHVMRDGGAGPRIQSSHPVDWLIWKRPSEEWSSFQLRETLLHWALRWGNGYAEIERDQQGRPFALYPIHPERVHVCRALDASVSSSGTDIPRARFITKSITEPACV
jgi:HK97 family phage portal protein